MVQALFLIYFSLGYTGGFLDLDDSKWVHILTTDILGADMSQTLSCVCKKFTLSGSLAFTVLIYISLWVLATERLDGVHGQIQ